MVEYERQSQYGYKSFGVLASPYLCLKSPLWITPYSVQYVMWLARLLLVTRATVFCATPYQSFHCNALPSLVPCSGPLNPVWRPEWTTPRGDFMRNEDQRANNEIMRGPYQTMNKKPRSHGKGNREKKEKGSSYFLSLDPWNKLLFSSLLDSSIILHSSSFLSTKPIIAEPFDSDKRPTQKRRLSAGAKIEKKKKITPQKLRETSKVSQVP